MTKKKVDTRSERKKKKDAAFAALPPGIIVRPLRFIRDNTQPQPILGAMNEVVGYKPSNFYKAARIAANRGNGAGVKMVARGCAVA